jgi:Asp-tRNA(Asn)/Glu-tRNA(Gln) amidotransferase A subunit family amidase
MDVLPGNYDSISHHGPLARTVDDVRLFLAATQGPDEADIQSVTTPLDLGAPIPADARGLRLGVSMDLGCWAVDPEIETAVRAAVEAWREAGAIVDEVEVGLTARDEELWAELWAVFMAAYYGHLLEEFRDRMDADVVRLIEAGNRMGAAHYKRLEVERTTVWRRVAAALDGRDALVCPTMAQAPWGATKAERPTSPFGEADGRYHSPDMTAVFNLVAPCPALSLPAGVHADGLPIGVQLVGHRWREDTVLRLGRALELARPWADRRPPIGMV